MPFRPAGLIAAADTRLQPFTLDTSKGAPLALAVALGISAVLTGCAPIILGGAVAGASAVYDRRHYQIVIDDGQIELSAMHALAQDRSVQAGSRISVTSYNHTVLLTGQAESEAVAERASALVSRLSKVGRVVDEVSIGPSITLTQESADTLITSRAKLALAKVELPGFNPTRVKVVTENAVVYLMGLVTPEEADAAAEQISYVPGVKQVVKLFEYNASGA
ncbi:BON domain-containing protein [Thiocystis violacea]|uniref:BON domain-containing protein n=1 Tax=Thiocystis violacea TaxID=13725 RepID=UPI001905F983|nr:BON domain-containing protein [Thiocystis violacea]MBK1721734.1 transporter [Thiocystis violacea]